MLNFNRVWFAATHVQLMVAHTQVQDALVDPQPRCVKDKVLKFGGETMLEKNLQSKTEKNASLMNTFRPIVIVKSKPRLSDKVYTNFAFAVIY